LLFSIEQELHMVAMGIESFEVTWHHWKDSNWRHFMWLLVAREPRQDAPRWRGRKWLAAFDAVIWPMVGIMLIHTALVPLGIVGPVAIAVALGMSGVRLHRAIWVNHRYWFTIWRWGRVALILILLGAVLKWL
jgi:hypothetical protein